jgi:hypothetical protein
LSNKDTPIEIDVVTVTPKTREKLKTEVLIKATTEALANSDCLSLDEGKTYDDLVLGKQVTDEARQALERRVFDYIPIVMSDGTLYDTEGRRYLKR